MPFPVLAALSKFSSTGTAPGAIARIILRFFQFVMALTVVGLYGVDIHHAHQAGVHADSRWIFAEVVGGLSAISVMVYGIPFLKSYSIFAWDVVIFLLWVVLFGIFGKIYIGAETGKDHGIVRMKHAVYVDAVNMILWCLSAGYSALLFFRHNKNDGEKNRAVV